MIACALWIQRFGRILRHPGDKKLVKTCALVSWGTHERDRLFSVKRTVEGTYGFAQKIQVRTYKPSSKGHETLAWYTSWPAFVRASGYKPMA